MQRESDGIRAAILLVVAALCAAAFIMIASIASSSDGGETTRSVVVAAIALTVFSLCGFAGWTLARSGRETAFIGYLTVVISVLALGTALWATLHLDPFTDEYQAVAFTALFAIAGGQISALMATSGPRDADAVRVTRNLTAVAAGALSVMVTIEITSPGRDVSPKAFGIVAVLYLLGALSLPLLRRLQQ